MNSHSSPFHNPIRLPGSGMLAAAWLFLLNTLCGTVLHGAVIPVENASFEKQALATGGWDNPITDWSKASVSDSFVERIEVLPAAPPNLPAVYFAQRGFNHIGIANQSAVWQELTDGPEAGKRYSLVVSIGNRAGATAAGNQSLFQLQMVYNGTATVLATRLVGANAIPVGEFRSYNLTWQAGASVPSGAKFRIWLECASTDRAHFDDVQLVKVETHPPSPDYQVHPQGPSGPQEPVPMLDSRASAPSVIYLDFDGETLDPMAEWAFGQTLTLGASGLNDQEMRRAWEAVKEDFLPFDVNVTTDAAKYWAARPGRRMRCIVTPTDIWQYEMDGEYGLTVDGIAKISSFRDAGLNLHRDIPCFAFISRWEKVAGIWEQRTNGTSAGLTASHEIGHTFGLLHDQAVGQPYYLGNGPDVAAFPGLGTKHWAPIMGSSALVTQWDRGEYAGASMDGGGPLQNDIAIIAAATGFAPDDNTATDAQSAVLVSTANDTIDKSGIIGRITTGTEDDDWWKINIPADGVLDLTVYPSEPFVNGDPVAQANLNLGIANLCPRMLILKSNFSTLLSVTATGDVTMPTNADRESAYFLQEWPLPAMRTTLLDAMRVRVVQQVNAGTYYIHISGAGVGNPATNGFSSYGSMGAYRLDGRIYYRPVVANAARYHALRVGVPWQFDYNAAGGPVTWSAIGLPPGLRVDSSSGLVTGAPLTHGTYTVQFTATGTGGQGTASVTFYVSHLNDLWQALEQDGAVQGAGIWLSDGTSGWHAQSATTFDGVDALQAGPVAAGQSAWIENTVRGPGYLTFRWRFSAHQTMAFVACSKNGTELKRLTTDDDWHIETIPLSTGTNTIRWTFGKQPGAVPAGADTAWVDTTLLEFDGADLPAAVEMESLTIDREGGSYWRHTLGEAGLSNSSDAARSGAITHGQNCGIATTITGPGTLRFRWAANCEPTHDYLVWFLDGTELGRRSSINTGVLVPFTNETITVPAGSHRIVWRYVKDVSVSDGADAVWIDAFLWNPSLQAPVITNPAAITWTVGQIVSHTITATNSPTSYGLTVLPPATTLSDGLVYSAADHLIVGIPQRPGSVTVSLSATNSAGTGTQNTVITVESAFAKWARDNGLSGGNALATADPDKDGRPNLLEMAFNLNPNVRETNFTPVTVNPTTKRLTATFTRVPSARDLYYEVQVSDNLSTWTTIASSLNGSVMTSSGAFSVTDAGGSAPVTVTVVDNAAPPTKTRRSMRIKITQF